MEEGLLKKNGMAILKGEIIAFGINILALIILSLIMTYSTISDSAIPTLVVALNTIAVLIGSSVATIKLQKRGIVNGIIIGSLYILIYLLISLISVSYTHLTLPTICSV